MSERINMPFTGEHFAAWCEKMVGQPYWYGSCVYKCTQNLLDRKAKQYPAHYTSGRMKRYKDDMKRYKRDRDHLRSEYRAWASRFTSVEFWKGYLGID